MEKPSAIADNMILPKAQSVVANIFDIPTDNLQLLPVDGGYSRNRRSLVGSDGKWAFVKEVDVALLSNEGREELRWLKKDYLCTTVLRRVIPEVVPEWSRLEADGRVLIMTAYRADDGWLWSPPKDLKLQARYVQAVVDATKKLEAVKFDRATIEGLNLSPYFRDELALDDGLVLIIQNKTIRDQLSDKYRAFVTSETHPLKTQYEQMITLLDSEKALQSLANRAAQLIEQPNDCFGHCDVRSDNLAFNPQTGEVKFVDWNWSSFATKGFGATEFLVDMARRGVDVKPWIKDLNVEMLAATVGYYTKRCLKDPLAPGNTLRDVQAESAAVALGLYNLATSS